MRVYLKLISVVSLTVVGALPFGCSSQKNSSQAKAQSTLTESNAQQLVAQAKDAKAKGQLAAAKTKEGEAADYYARIGELLLMPEGFKYADDMFAKALEIDPSNGKANFYKAFTEPFLQLQGFLPRFERLADSDEQIARLERLRERIAKLNMPEVADFATKLPGGASPFRDYYDLQRFARESLLPSLVASLDKLSKIDLSTPLKLNFTPSRAMIDSQPSVNYEYTYSECQNDATNGWSCTQYTTQYYSQQSKPRNLYFVDQYDMKAMKSLLRASIDQIRLGTAYSAKDGDTAIRRLKAIAADRDLTDQDVVSVLNSYSGLLTLESDHQLSQISVSTTQALKDGMELAALSDQLCSGGSRNELTSLIVPICIGVDTANSYQLGLDLLAGPKDIILGHDEDGNAVTIEIDVSVLLKNPVRDIKALLPTTFAENGKATHYPDRTMGGLFPQGDIIAKLKQVADVSPQEKLGDAVSGYMHSVRTWIGIENNDSYGN